MKLNIISTIKKVSTVALTGALALSLVVQPGNTEAAKALKGKITISGSSALLPLTNQAAKDFKKKNPKVIMSVTGSSSVAGPQAVLKGAATIGACDWDASKDVPGFKAFSGVRTYAIAVIPFATIVHESNPVTNLTTSQLQGIYSGKIKNWKEVGGKDDPIVVVNRAVGSGTRVNYQMKALKGADFMSSGSNYKEVGKSGDMLKAVDSNPNAIGYVDLAYVKGNVKKVQYNGISATVSNVISKKYPVYGTGYLVTKGPATGANKAFIDYIRSASFQNNVVKKLKFVPLSAMK